jgi:hypothetical protein
MDTFRKPIGPLLVLASVVATACPPTIKPTEADRVVVGADFADLNQELPSAWQLDAISEALPQPQGEQAAFPTTDTAVLAWRVREDDRPFRVVECLALKRFEDSSAGRRWVLACLFEASPGVWHVGQVQYVTAPVNGKPSHCVWVRHCRTYRSCPQNADIYAFMDDFDWSLTPTKGWRLLKGRVCTSTWRTVIGQEPTRLFSP